MPTQKKAKAPVARAKTKPAKTARSAGSQPADRSARGKVQGEGDYASAREFNQDQREFVETHDTEELGREAAPRDAGENAELEAAERKGKARAKPDPESAEGREDTDGDDERDDDLERGRS